MADPTQAPGSGEGTTEGTPTKGTTPTAPATGEGRAEGQAAPATPAPAVSGGTSQDAEFMDGVNLEELPPELKPVWEATHRQMKAALTRKFQEFAGDKDLLAQAKAFVADPARSLQLLAEQQGFKLTKAEAQQAVAQAQDGPWQPETYEEIVERAKRESMEEFQKRFSPIIQNVQKLQAKNVEDQLDGIDKNWRNYETGMKSVMAKHPTLVNDIPTLYRMSVPQEVWESRAVQAALKKMKDTTSAASVGGTSTVRKTTPTPKKATSFAEAVEVAKAELASKGG